MGGKACRGLQQQAVKGRCQYGRKWANFRKYNFLRYTCNIRIARNT